MKQIVVTGAVLLSAQKLENVVGIRSRIPFVQNNKLVRIGFDVVEVVVGIGMSRKQGDIVKPAGVGLILDGALDILDTVLPTV